MLAAGSRQFQAAGPYGGYTVDEVAPRHDAGVAKATSDPAEAYARFPAPAASRFVEGWLPAQL